MFTNVYNKLKFFVKFLCGVAAGFFITHSFLLYQELKTDTNASLIDSLGPPILIALAGPFGSYIVSLFLLSIIDFLDNMNVIATASHKIAHNMALIQETLQNKKAPKPSFKKTEFSPNTQKQQSNKQKPVTKSNTGSQIKSENLNNDHVNTSESIKEKEVPAVFNFASIVNKIKTPDDDINVTTECNKNETEDNIDDSEGSNTIEHISDDEIDNSAYMDKKNVSNEQEVDDDSIQLNIDFDSIQESNTESTSSVIANDNVSTEIDNIPDTDDTDNSDELNNDINPLENYNSQAESINTDVGTDRSSDIISENQSDQIEITAEAYNDRDEHINQDIVNSTTVMENPDGEEVVNQEDILIDVQDNNTENISNFELTKDNQQLGTEELKCPNDCSESNSDTSNTVAEVVDPSVFGIDTIFNN